MKNSFLLLSTLTLTFAFGASSAQAQQSPEPAKEGGARWHYAPNVWKVEQPRIPHEMEAAPGVRQGSVPQSPSFLGLDNNLLSRPVPQAAPRVAARPVPTSQISHKLFVPNTTFKPDFGKPVQPLQAGEPVKMATLPPGAGSPIPQTAAAPPAVNKATAPVHHATSSAPRHIAHSTALSGKLKTPTHAHGESATPIAASYNTGYVPGGLLPSQSGAGMRTNTNLSGRVLSPKH